MQFKGQLLLPGEAGAGLRVNLDVAEHHLAVESDGGGLGAWPLEVVDVVRQGDVFDLTVAGEALRFLADDTIAFAYSGVPTIERVSRRPRARSAFRSMLDWIWNGRESSAPPTSVQPVSDEPASPSQQAEDFGDSVPAPSHLPHDPEIGSESFDEDGNVEVLQEIPAVFEAESSPPEIEDLAVSPGCPAIRGDGRRCESPILTESGFCYPHDPKRAFEDKYQAAQQARAQLKRDATARLNRIYGRLDKAMRQVEKGELDPETAMAMAQLARTMCAILEVDEADRESHR